MNQKRRSVIQTDRLCLCAIQDADEEALLQILTDPRVYATFMVPDLKSSEEAHRMFVRIKSLSDSEDRFVYGVYLDGTLIGLVNEVEKIEDSIELGFAIHPAHQRKGFATEILAACIVELFEMGFASVITGAFAENVASIRVMEKCGMTKLEKTESVEYRGEIHSCVFFSKSNTLCLC